MPISKQVLEKCCYYHFRIKKILIIYSDSWLVFSVEEKSKKLISKKSFESPYWLRSVQFIPVVSE